MTVDRPDHRLDRDCEQRESPTAFDSGGSLRSSVVTLPAVSEVVALIRITVAMYRYAPAPGVGDIRK